MSTHNFVEIKERLSKIEEQQEQMLKILKEIKSKLDEQE
jgi:tetrahydromethanopterin S-methyltransferase subunit G